MRTTITVVLGAMCLTSAFVFADKPDESKSANDKVSTLFLGMTIAFRYITRPNRHGMQ